MLNSGAISVPWSQRARVLTLSRPCRRNVARLLPGSALPKSRAAVPHLDEDKLCRDIPIITRATCLRQCVFDCQVLGSTGSLPH